MKVFLGQLANIVKFLVMEIFLENIEVLENFQAKTEIFHAKMEIFHAKKEIFHAKTEIFPVKTKIFLG
jgi:hypothetical protein